MIGVRFQLHYALRQLARLFFVFRSHHAHAAWHGPLEGQYGDICANLGCDLEKTVKEMKAQCRATNPENHCTGFSGGGVLAGEELKGGCFRACSPENLVAGITLIPGGESRAYYWQDEAADMLPAEAGGRGLVFMVVLLGLYMGGGALYNKRAGATGWNMIPHRREWAHLRGLTLDGVAFCRSGGQKQQHLTELRAPTAGGNNGSEPPPVVGTKRSKEKKNKDKDRSPRKAGKGSTKGNVMGGTETRGGRWVHVSS